jgi:hypothetical protein
MIPFSNAAVIHPIAMHMSSFSKLGCSPFNPRDKAVGFNAIGPNLPVFMSAVAPGNIFYLYYDVTVNATQDQSKAVASEIALTSSSFSASNRTRVNVSD